MALLVKLMRRQWSLVLFSIIATGLSAGITLWWNSQLANIINTLGAGQPLLLATVAAALVTALALCACSGAKVLLAAYTCERMAHSLRMAYARHYAALSLQQAEETGTGAQLSGLQNELSDISRYLSGSFFQLFDDIVTFACTLLWLLVLNPTLTLSVNLPSLLILVYITFSSKAIGTATTSSQQAKSSMNQSTDLLLSAFPVIRLYNAITLALHEYRAQVQAWQQLNSRMERLRARLMSLSGLLSGLPPLFLLLVGGHMVMAGSLPLGSLYVFINLSGNITGVMGNLPARVAELRQFAANLRRVAPRTVFLQRGEHTWK